MRVLAILAMGLLPAIAPAASPPFELKGRVLGAGESEACGQAVVVTHQSLLEETGVTDVPFPASSCEVEFGTVAGLALQGPAKLLFWKGRLIRVVINFGQLDLHDFAALRSALIDLYHKPDTRKRPPFNTDTWRHGGARLEIERTENFPTKANLYLTESIGWDEYQRASERASKAIDILDRQRRRDDIRRYPQ